MTIQAGKWDMWVGVNVAVNYGLFTWFSKNTNFELVFSNLNEYLLLHGCIYLRAFIQLNSYS